ncbi:MAG: hypothetical protein COZ11_09340 [Deltaproteobacteria bacterium CG_4_10_14_3_um_filter_51_14]|nr:MAG: hypothetical protein COZ11_09340 [Deltaproteobacteria bacterium CG_4_10_14_3_um_filter_51_14]
MRITIETGIFYDTERDFSSEERHILQKLFLWETMAKSIEEFRNKKAEALAKGWNSSGPVPMSAAMSAVTSEMEKRVMKRLREGNSGSS